MIGLLMHPFRFRLDHNVESINQLYLSNQPTMGSINTWNTIGSPKIFTRSLTRPVSNIRILFSLIFSPIPKLGNNWQPWIIGVFGLALSFGQITDFIDEGILDSISI